MSLKGESLLGDPDESRGIEEFTMEKSSGLFCPIDHTELYIRAKVVGEDITTYECHCPSKFCSLAVAYIKVLTQGVPVNPEPVVDLSHVKEPLEEDKDSEVEC